MFEVRLCRRLLYFANTGPRFESRFFLTDSGVCEYSGDGNDNDGGENGGDNDDNEDGQDEQDDDEHDEDNEEDNEQQEQGGNGEGDGELLGGFWEHPGMFGSF